MLFLVVVALLIVLVLFLELVDVGVPYFPLSDLSPEVICYWRASGSSSFLDGGVDGLNLSTLIIELVPHSLFDGIHIFSRPGLLLLRLSLDLFKFSFSDVLDFFLDFVLVGGSVDVVSLETQVHNQLVNGIIRFIFAIQVVIHNSVRLSQRVGNYQCLCDCEVQFGRRQPSVVRDFLNHLKFTWV